MPTIRFKLNGQPASLSFVDDYKPGDPPPTGYMDWHAWAEVQHKAGLRQKKCGRCSKWKFPQELGELVDLSHPFDSSGQHHEHRSPVCKECEAKNPQAINYGKTELPKKRRRRERK